MIARARAAFAACAAAAALASCQTLAGEASPLAKRYWTVKAIHCPAGCSGEIRGFLDGMIGKRVEIGEHRFVAPFADGCEGDVTLRLSHKPAKQVLDDVNKGIAPERKLAAGALPLARDEVFGGLVYCRSGKLDLPIANLLSVEPDRVLVLFEEQSLIELR